MANQTSQSLVYRPFLEHNTHSEQPPSNISLSNFERPKAESINTSNEIQKPTTVDMRLTTGLIRPPTVQQDRVTVYTILVDKLASLTGTNSSEIEPIIPLSDLGLDSFLALDFQSWINSTFSISIEISDILDSRSLSNFAALVAQKSLELGQNLQDIKENKGVIESSKTRNVARAQKREPAFQKLPNLPLPRLESTLNTYLSSIEPIATSEELANTKRIVTDFVKPNSIGPILHARLKEREDNPNLDNWLCDLYIDSNFLGRNTPLAPFSSFFYTHDFGKSQQTQSERAAAITVAVRKFKGLYEAGKVQPEQLNGQDTCMYSFQWLFNTYRMPFVGPDQMEKFKDEDYIVVLRFGRVFKVALKDDHGEVTYTKLRATFQAILEKIQGNASLVGVLTADDRNSWAQVRELVRKASDSNAQCLRVIERASFLICLDDASPETPAERAYHYHFGDGSNRWWDKGLQFAICSNGVSGEIVEHTMLDASTIYPLNVFLCKEIMAYTSTTASPSDLTNIELEEYLFVTTPEIDNHIERVRREYQKSCAGYEHRFFHCTTFGASLARQSNIPPKSTFQMAVALASFAHFGYNPALWDGVSLSSFYRGRVENNQVTLPSVVSFTTAALDPSIPISDRRKLLFAAAKIHANSITRAVRGRGFDRYMSSLRQMVRDGEDVPELFKDPVYQRSRPRKIMSHCYQTCMAETGYVLRDADAIWAHFEVDDNSAKFSLTGRSEKVESFEARLKESLEIVRVLLVSI